MVTHVIYLGEWIRVRPRTGSHQATGFCSQCRRGSLAVGWHSTKTREFRCVKCFDAEAQHFK